MSQVKVKDREKNDFQVILKARELASYTTRIVSNPKVFDTKPNLKEPEDPKEKAKQEKLLRNIPIYNSKLALLERIDKVATDIYLNAWRANNVRVTNKSSYHRRNNYQHYAVEGCIELLALIEKAKNVFHLRYKKYSFWSKSTQEVRKMLSGWISSDSTRYSKYRKQ